MPRYLLQPRSVQYRGTPQSRSFHNSSRSGHAIYYTSNATVLRKVAVDVLERRLNLLPNAADEGNRQHCDQGCQNAVLNHRDTLAVRFEEHHPEFTPFSTFRYSQAPQNLVRRLRNRDGMHAIVIVPTGAGSLPPIPCSPC